MRTAIRKGAAGLVTELLVRSPFRQRFRRVGDSSAVIFTLHRTSMPESGVGGHSLSVLRGLLSRLRKLRVPIVELGDIVAATRGHRELPGLSVAFTLDDGYWDQADITVPLLLEYDVLPTIFLITGFMDGALWPWDARVRELFRGADKSRIEIDVGSSRLRYDISSAGDRQRARRSFDALCKSVPEERRDQLIIALAAAVGADPDLPVPPVHRAMGWERARELEVLGVRFGAHSVSHCVFSRASAERAQIELRVSRDRINAELRHPLPVFAWPIGRAMDFGARDLRLASEAGYVASVSMEPRDVDLSDAGQSSPAVVLPRHGFPDSGPEALRLVFGLAASGPLARRQGIAVDPRRVDRLVFVCKGNICRSPYAAVYATTLGMAAVSCGIEAAPGARADPQALRNALIRGIDLSGHASSRLDETSLRPGDLVIYMEPGQAGPVVRRAGPAGAQHAMASSWLATTRPKIIDPFGRDDVVFQAVFDQLDEAVGSIIRGIALPARLGGLALPVPCCTFRDGAGRTTWRCAAPVPVWPPGPLPQRAAIRRRATRAMARA